MNTFFKVGIFIAASTSLVSGKSLWHSQANNEMGVMSDAKAVTIGDIVFIAIDESTSVSNSLNKSVSGNQSIGGGITDFFNSGIINHNGSIPNLASSAQQSLTGSGNTSIEKTISSKVAVVVTDRLPNGNLIIGGVKQTFSSGERQYIVLSGIVRRQDIDSDNMVPSSRIANAQIEFLDEGSLADSQKRSLLMNIMDKVNLW